MIKREFLRSELKHHMAQISASPVELKEGDKETSSYILGQRLGYQDGLKAALELLDQLPAEPPPAPRRIYGESEAQYAQRVAAHKRTFYHKED